MKADELENAIREEDETRAARIFGEYRDGSTPRHNDIQMLCKCVVERIKNIRLLEIELDNAREVIRQDRLQIEYLKSDCREGVRVMFENEKLVNEKEELKMLLDRFCTTMSQWVSKNH
jgi:hypothetical protein